MLFEIEHEIRSMTHPLYNRPLVNRNPHQTNRHYILGGDAWVPTLPDGLGMSNMVERPAKGAKGPDDRQAPRAADAAAGRVAQRNAPLPQCGRGWRAQRAG